MAYKVRDKFYVSSEWVKLRNSYISEFPLCEVCEKKGLVVVATEIDHKVPVRINSDLSLDWDNLQALCHRCHMKKTKAVDNRLLQGLKPKAWMGADADGNLLDSEVW